MISLRIVIVPGPNYDKIKTQGLIYIQLTFGNGLDYEYYQTMEWTHGRSSFAQTQDFKQSNGFCHS